MHLKTCPGSVDSHHFPGQQLPQKADERDETAVREARYGHWIAHRIPGLSGFPARNSQADLTSGVDKAVNPGICSCRHMHRQGCPGGDALMKFRMKRMGERSLGSVPVAPGCNGGGGRQRSPPLGAIHRSIRSVVTTLSNPWTTRCGPTRSIHSPHSPANAKVHAMTPPAKPLWRHACRRASTAMVWLPNSPLAANGPSLMASARRCSSARC